MRSGNICHSERRFCAKNLSESLAPRQERFFASLRMTGPVFAAWERHSPEWRYAQPPSRGLGLPRAAGAPGSSQVLVGAQHKVCMSACFSSALSEKSKESEPLRMTADEICAHVRPDSRV